MQLKECDIEKFDRVRTLLKDGIDTAWLDVLSTIITPIVEIVGDDEAGMIRKITDNTGESVGCSHAQFDVDLEQSREKFNYSFCKFIRIISSLDVSIFGTPLVIVLGECVKFFVV